MSIVCVMASCLAALTSVQDVCAQHPERVTFLFEQLDLSTPGLEATAAAVEAGDWPEACNALLAYYREVRLPAYRAKYGHPQATTHSQQADLLLNDTFVYFGLGGKVPRVSGGGWDWEDTGPENDREWAWGMNRHFHLGTLLQAYQATGEAKYLDFLHANLLDWLVTSGYSGEKTNGARWRGLETALRMRSWPTVFFELLEEPGFSDAARILLLSRLPEHAHYLRNFHGQGNWLTMEMNGLATIAIVWPEFKDAPAWANYAAKTAGDSMLDQVYPDGVQKELTSHYHRVALINFQDLANRFEGTPYPLPDYYRPTLEKMWGYLAYSMRPDGYGVMSNDSDHDHTRPSVLQQAIRYERGDWLYIASNGAEGTKPERGPSVVFPWAGQAMLRSGWDPDARWAFFELGPYGIGHQHQDRLHFSLHAYGRDLLVDPGRYTYVGGPWREYFRGPKAHNIVLIDGHGPGRYELEATEPLPETAYDLGEDIEIVRGAFDGPWNGLGIKAHQQRTVARVTQGEGADYFVVVDEVQCAEPQPLQALWHFHPDCTVAEEGGALRTTDAGKGNLTLTPSAGMDWEVTIVKGQEEPEIQGWYSPEYYQKAPSTAAVYASAPVKDALFAWVIVPGKGDVDAVKDVTCVREGDKVVVDFTWPSGQAQHVEVKVR